MMANRSSLRIIAYSVHLSCILLPLLPLFHETISVFACFQIVSPTICHKCHNTVCLHTPQSQAMAGIETTSSHSYIYGQVKKVKHKGYNIVYFWHVLTTKTLTT